MAWVALTKDQTSFAQDKMTWDLNSHVGSVVSNTQKPYLVKNIVLKHYFVQSESPPYE